MRGRARPPRDFAFLAAPLVLSPDRVLEEAFVVVRKGRVAGVGSRPPRGSSPILDLRPAAVLPGLVNAHAHLDLTESGARRRGPDFVEWIRRVLRAREETSGEDALRAIDRGARRLLEAGATTVADHDASALSARALARGPIRGAVLRETIEPDPSRAAAALRSVERWLSRFPRAEGLRRGLAPHAPHTVSAALLRELARLARRRDLPLSIHLAETEEEVRCCVRGEGPLAELLRERRGALALEPGLSPLERLEAASALGPRTLLVHANRLDRGERERIARSGATVVLCPGTHLFFGRDDFPSRRLREAGVRLALGTDGLASNDALDPFLEMARWRELDPSASAEAVFGGATVGAAEALGRPRRTGTLLPGAPADFVRVACPRNLRARDALEFVTRTRPRLLGAWIAGRSVFLAGGKGRAIVPNSSRARETIADLS